MIVDKKDKILKLIEELYSDTSVHIDRTEESLIEIKEEINERLSALRRT